MKFLSLISLFAGIWLALAACIARARKRAARRFPGFFNVNRAFFGTLMAITFSAFCPAQSASQDVSPAQLQTVISLPIDQALKQRETYKTALKSAYERQTAMTGKDCQPESRKGQQPYNICMGTAHEQADQDFRIFYNNLQMMCHDLDTLTALQSSHKAWLTYEESAMKAGHGVWPDGTGAPGFRAQVYLSLVRDHMRELNEIFEVNYR